MTNLKFRFAVILSAFLMLITVLCGMSGNAYAAITAPSDVVNFDETNVMDDLAGSTVDGVPFDLNQYNFDPAKPTQLFSVVEYCYSFYTDRQANYALYTYVYNPQGIAFDVYSTSNKIQLSTGDDENYYKYPLLFLSSSTTAGYEGLFIKFKVLLTDGERGRILSSLNSSERQYRVSGIELLTSGEWTAHDYNVSKAWIYKGYAAGYGSVESNSLTCTEDTTRTLQLDVHHTYYRQSTSFDEYQTQIDTVYFAVPRSVFDKYEKLQQIKAEWYEYKTKKIAVTSHKEFYDKAREYVGEYIGDNYNKSVYYGLISGNVKAWPENIPVDSFYWNSVFCNDSDNPASPYRNFKRYNTCIPVLYYVFYTENDISSYDPYSTTVEQGGIESNDLYNYIKSYKDKNSTAADVEYLPIKDGRIRADLFEDDIDEYRKVTNERGTIQKGYSCYNFDADLDVVQLNNYPSTFTDSIGSSPLFSVLLGSSTMAAGGVNLAPFYVLKASDVAGTSDSERRAISRSLLVNYNDVPRLQEFYNAAVTDDDGDGLDDEEKVVVLFRFAVTDYYAVSCDISQDKVPGYTADNMIDGRAYIAQQSVFLDFDIIQLSFRDPSSEHDVVYGVVSDPIDIIDDITPPSSMAPTTHGCKANSILSIVLLLSFVIIVILLLIVISKRKKGGKSTNVADCKSNVPEHTLKIVMSTDYNSIKKPSSRRNSYYRRKRK